jgi:hypothetical protein
VPLPGRKLFGGSTILAVVLALGFSASSLAAQKTNFDLAGETITFPSPAAADYTAGWINSTAGVTFNINSLNGLARTTTVSIRATSPTLGNGKPIGELQWRRSDLATWNSITITDAQVEQRLVINKGLNDPWGNTIFFRMLLDWTKDGPGTYTATYQLTLSQTVP